MLLVSVRNESCVPSITRDILQMFIIFIDVWSWNHKDLLAVPTADGAVGARFGGCWAWFSGPRLLEG
jgi:hypothetical protein